MKLVNMRDVFSEHATLGTLTIDDKHFGYVCEDTDRGLDSSMPLAEIKRLKVKGRTAIPTGVYRVGIRYSPGHKKDMLYLQDVPGYQYILLHTGNTAEDTEGCQLLGLTRSVPSMSVGKSTPAIAWIEAQLMPLIRQGAEVTYEVRAQR